MAGAAYFTPAEVLALLDERPAVTRPAAGGVVVAKAGVVGVGATRQEAVADWWRKFRGIVARPKPAPAGDTGTHTPGDGPTG